MRKIKALDVSGTEIDDRGVAFLSRGLPNLQCLDVQRCPRLTDRGVARSISNGSLAHMKALNFRGTNIGDASVIQLTRAMPKVKHLNLSKYNNITNKSVSSIGTLTDLETLSLEGAKVDDVGLGIISLNTKLNLLNVTGCSISRNSLLEVIESLGYVRESPHFFGFLIRSSDAKVSALRERERQSLYLQRNSAAHSMQGLMKSKRNAINELRSFQEIRRHRAASIIQSQLMNSMSRQRCQSLWFIGCQRRLSVQIQQLGRGWLARRKFSELVAKHRLACYIAIFVEKLFRGNYVRSRDALVRPALLRLRRKRLHEKQNAAALVIQCWLRRLLAAFLVSDFIRYTNASRIIETYTRRKQIPVVC